MVTIVIVAALLVMGLSLWALQRRLIYFPDAADPDVSAMPVAWEEAGYETSDGVVLNAWLHAPEPGQPIVIVFSGNGGNRGDRLPLGAGLADQGVGVLLTDYRGYGGNPGHPTESGLAMDARAALEFVEDRYSQHAVVYFGESLGAGVAIGLAATVRPSALILRSPFTSLVDAAREHYPWLPVDLMLKDRYPSIDAIAEIAVPTLVIAGDNDSLVPLSQSVALYEAAPGPKRLLVIEGAGHNDAALASGEEVLVAVRLLLEDADLTE